MLFQSSVPALFRSMNLTYNSSVAQARKAETAKRLDFYHDSQLERLEEQLNELFSDPSSMIKVELNIVKKIINNLTTSYKISPVRTLENATKKDQALYSKILEDSQFDIKLKQASRYTKLLKTILIRPTYIEDRIDLQILTGNLLDVVTSKESPEALEKVLVTDYGTSGRVEEIEFSLWTKETWSRLSHQGIVLDQAENPYRGGVLPFIPCFDYSPPSSGFWLPGGSDIISMQEAINIKLTDLLYLIQNQSFGIGYLKGSLSGGSLKADPGSIISIGESDEIGFISQKSEVISVLSGIDKLIKWICVSNGLSASSMSTDPQTQSGVSKIQDSKELAEMRTDDIALWRSYEKKLFNLIRTVFNFHSPKKLSENATLKIDFTEVENRISTKDQAIADDLKIAQGVRSPVDIAMRDNPDLASREDALAYLLKIKEELKAIET